MSADNYYLVRIHRGQFAVSMGFASDEYATPGGWPRVRKTDRRFKRLGAALDYAASEYAEYGPYYTRPVMAMVRHGRKKKASPP